MELMILITVLCTSLSLLQTPCASLQIDQMQVQPPREQADEAQISLSWTTMPRKLLRFTAEVTVKGHGGEDKIANNKQQKEDAPAGKRAYNKEHRVMHGSKGTWQEWVEGADPSQYFTMDYSHVKRRRPIHNKSLPAAVAP